MMHLPIFVFAAAASGAMAGGGLRDQDPTARSTVAFLVVLTIFKCVADNAPNTLPSINVFLDGNFVLSSLLGDAPTVHINALGVFADDDEVQILRLDSL